MNGLIRKMKGIKSGGVRPWLPWIILIIVCCFFLPPIIKAVRNALKAGKSVTDALGEAVTGVAESGSRLLAALGIGKSPYTDKLNMYKHPPITSCWNRDFWKGKVTEAQKIELWERMDFWAPKNMDDLMHWYGYDVDQVKSLLYQNYNSQIAISALTDWCLINRGVSFIKWLNSGWWVVMSDKETVEVAEFAETFPFDLPY